MSVDLEKRKCFFLLRAFNFLVREHGLDACLIVIGSGPDRDKLEKYCLEEGLSDMVIFTGKESHERVIAFYQLSDVFVFPPELKHRAWLLLRPWPAACLLLL